VPALFGQWGDHWARADLKRGREVAAELRELDGAAGDVPTQVLGYDVDGFTCFELGEFGLGRANLEKAIALCDPVHRSWFSGLLPYDALVMLRLHSSFPLACLGHLDQALSERDAVLAEARRLSHPLTLALVLASSAISGSCLRLEPGLLLQYADELLALAGEHELGPFRLMGLIERGWCLAGLGLRTRAFRFSRPAWPAWRSLDSWSGGRGF
jgi:hypothetical protein